jgi:hypothetical protein
VHPSGHDPDPALRGAGEERLGQMRGADGDDLEVEPPAEGRRRLGHRGPVPRELRVAAARQQDEPPARLRRERRRPGEALPHVVDERVSRADRVGAEGAEQLGLEREEGDHAAGAPRDRLRAAAPPRPDLGRDVVDERHAEPAQAAGEETVEVREVDEDRRVRAAADRLGAETGERAAQRRRLSEDFGHADDRERLGGDDTVETRGLEARAAHAEGGQVRPRAAQRREQARRELVARGLAGGDQDVHRKRLRQAREPAIREPGGESISHR